MSHCTFIAAGCDLPEKPHPDYETFLEVDTAKGTVYDGDRDDDFALLKFEDVRSYTDLSYGVYVEWNYCTEGRANMIIEYIREALNRCDQVQFWSVWLMDYYEYDERPFYKLKEIEFDKLTTKDILEIVHAEVWERSRQRPTYYGLIVKKS